MAALCVCTTACSKGLVGLYGGRLAPGHTGIIAAQAGGACRQLCMVGAAMQGPRQLSGASADLSEELQNVQKRLISRDAAAKKYKEGCRSLKERVEHLQQVQPV
jgi:hypothetical protein